MNKQQGDALVKLLQFAKENHFALPAVNCIRCGVGLPADCLLWMIKVERMIFLIILSTLGGVILLFNFCMSNFIVFSLYGKSSSSINAVLESAREANSPVMIQFSNGGASFYAGKAVNNAGQSASVAGAVAGALHGVLRQISNPSRQ